MLKSLNKIQAILVAVILFILLHYLLTIASNYLANNSEQFISIFQWLNLAAYFLYILCGFISGMLSKQHLIIVGLITGLASALLVVLIFGVAGGDAFGVFSTLITGTVLGGIGGVFSWFLKRKATNSV